ncbi:MAG: EAL domain-containing protein [Geminicoccaceae bacterium]
MAGRPPPVGPAPPLLLHLRARPGDGPCGFAPGSLGTSGGDEAVFPCDRAPGPLALERWLAAIHPDDLPTYLAAQARRSDAGQDFHVHYRMERPDGRGWRWMQEIGWTVRDGSGAACWLDSCVLATATWAGGPQADGPELGEGEPREGNRYRQLIEAAPVPMLVYVEGRCIYANPAALELLGAVERGTMLGRRLEELVEAPGRAQREETLAALAHGGGDGPREILCRRFDGRRIWVEASAATITEGGAPALQLVLVDLTARKHAEATMRRIAHHDALTGLPNRLVLMDRLSQAIARARREGDQVALMILDLDGFKEVNDLLGHAAGDELLCQVARRIRQSLRASDTLARLGGDEFAIVQLGLGHPRGAAALADKVIDALAAPFLIDGQEAAAGASIGISLFPADGDTPGTLLKQADLALYRAKQAGRSRACFFAPELDEAAQSRRLLAVDLRAAFEHGDLMLAYQPQIELASRRVVAAEALLRWRDPLRGLVPAAGFIRVAESSGLIRPLGAWAIDAVCAQGHRWRAAGRQLDLAVNIAAAQLRDPGFAALIADALARHELPARHLCLELTEAALSTPFLEDAAEVLRELAALAVRIAIDDFGTGCSALVSLKRLPVQQLKIDRTLISGIGNDRDSEAIIAATVKLAHSLGKEVVAEGVERHDQHDFLAELRCDRAQGYLYAHPLAAEDLVRHLP